jgi:hypothetical protein
MKLRCSSSWLRVSVRRVGQIGLVAHELGARLVQIGLVHARIEREQQVARLDALAFLDMHRANGARHLRAHLHGLHRHHIAVGVHFQRHIALLDDSRGNRGHGRALGGRLRRKPVLPAKPAGDNNHKHGHDGRPARSAAAPVPAAALQLPSTKPFGWSIPSVFIMRTLKYRTARDSPWRRLHWAGFIRANRY